MKQDEFAADLELLHELCGDIANRGSSTSLEAGQGRQLREEYECFEKSGVPHPILSNKTIGEVQEESLRRRMVSFLSATL
jgi:hypothetical protein